MMSKILASIRRPFIARRKKPGTEPVHQVPYLFRRIYDSAAILLTGNHVLPSVLFTIQPYNVKNSC